MNDRPDRSPDTAPAGWYPDPLGRYDHRWYNGTAWTADVSVDGRRFVDPVPLDAPSNPTHVAPVAPVAPVSGIAPSGSAPFGPAGWPPMGTAHGVWVTPPSPPSRTLAVLALIAGLVAVTTGWMPIFFVLGAIAGIAAITLGIVARSRIRAGRARGSGMALAGLVLGPIGLATCVVGVVLTGTLLREVREYTEPGPVDVEITSCAAEGRAVRITGTIENLDDETHDYSIVVEVLDDGDLVERDSTELTGVVAGEVRDWERLLLTRGRTPAVPECEIFAVNGPFPFGLDPNP
ncbi:MAG: DUF4190 domain-containing protein [Actinobacteria bacterium]|nr:DUF4190 domain-containing protein [Actinomycetota bacterium]